jgi:1-acyl-sn-glycerol-3-phosphate acyltransferase
MASIFLSKHTRLYISQWLANQFWALFPFVTEVWSNTPFIFTGNGFDHSAPQTANCVLLGNHAPGMDFVTGITLSSLPFGPGCGRMMTMMKKSLECYPVIGWTHSLQGSLFLKRDWAKDEKHLTARLNELETNVYPWPYWMGVYPEGTRITPKKRIESQAFAKLRNLPILEHLLLPRTKGFLYLLKHVSTSLTHIYDATCAYLGSPLLPHHPFIYGRFICTGVHVHMTVTNVKDLTKSDDPVIREKERETWLLQQWKRKDELLEDFNKSQHFPGKPYVIASSRRAGLRNLFFIWSFIVVAMASQIFSPNTLILSLVACALTQLKITVERVERI